MKLEPALINMIRVREEVIRKGIESRTFNLNIPRVRKQAFAIKNSTFCSTARETDSASKTHDPNPSSLSCLTLPQRALEPDPPPLL
jgi:hypothetical protein